MRFHATTGPIAPGTLGPDPVVAPGTVPDFLLLRLPQRRPFGDGPIESVLLTLDAAAGETVTFELWLLEESTEAANTADDPGALAANRKFYRLATGIVLTAHRLTLVQPYAPAVTPIPAGVWYVRTTADTLAAAGRIRAVVV
jgi:hypothetical protein